jgi:hypothetical protein
MKIVIQINSTKIKQKVFNLQIFLKHFLIILKQFFQFNLSNQLMIDYQWFIKSNNLHS